MLFSSGEIAISFQFNSDSAKTVRLGIKEGKTKQDGKFLSEAAEAGKRKFFYLKTGQ